jgi:hypothetical protein
MVSKQERWFWQMSGATLWVKTWDITLDLMDIHWLFSHLLHRGYKVAAILMPQPLKATHQPQLMEFHVYNKCIYIIFSFSLFCKLTLKTTTISFFVTTLSNKYLDYPILTNYTCTYFLLISPSWLICGW